MEKIKYFQKMSLFVKINWTFLNIHPLMETSFFENILFLKKYARKKFLMYPLFDQKTLHSIQM